MYNYKAGIAQLNQKIALQNATWAESAGDVSAEEKGLQGAQEVGQTKATQAASNLDVNSGTAQAVRDTQTRVSAFDQDIIRFNAAKTAYGYQAKAAGDVAEANLDTAAAQTAKQAGWLGAAGSILGGVSNVSSKWLQGQNIGIFGGGSAPGGSSMGNATMLGGLY